MDKQRQQQMINQIFEQNAKTEDDISKLSDEERKEYLRSRLRQKMFYSSAGRQSKQQKNVLQEKMQKQMEKKNQEEEERKKRMTEKNRKKRQRKRLNRQQNQNKLVDSEEVVKVETEEIKESNEEPVIVKDESDYESD